MLKTSVIPREVVKKVRFVVESAEEIKGKAVVRIDRDEPYEKGRPVPGGLFDPRMGVIESGEVCATCKNEKDDCPGHYGYVELALPVYHKQFLPQIKKILNSVCPLCCELLLGTTELGELRSKGEDRLSEVAKMSDGREYCPNCKVLRGAKIPHQPKYAEDARDYIVISKSEGVPKDMGVAKQVAVEEEEMDEDAEEPEVVENGEDEEEEEEEEEVEVEAEGDEEEVFEDVALDIGDGDKETKGHKHKEMERFPASKALRILSRLTNRTVDLLGYDSQYMRPENFIVQNLLVSPPAIRPTYTPKAKQRREDDLTEHLKLIIKTNNQLKSLVESNASEKLIATKENELTEFVAKMVDNKKRANQTLLVKGREPLESITDRLGHKTGRLRGNLEGKRVDFSARTVISPDPNMNIDEFGIPLSVAMELTVPLVVTKENEDYCYQLLYNGADVYPGANFLRQGRDRIKRITNISNIYDIVLNEGDVLERHMQDGDVIVVNRQPTLHRQSMCGMRARILPGNTFRMNPSSCEGFNADFDGDEMNVHSVRSSAAIAEIEGLSLLSVQIIDHRDGAPLYGVIQDTETGLALLTAGNTFLNRNQCIRILSGVREFDGHLPPPAKGRATGDDSVKGELWSGRQLVSLVMPRINYKGSSSSKNFFDSDSDKNIVIENGQLLSGIIDKSSVHPRTPGGIIHIIYNDFGPETLVRFLHDIHSMVNEFLRIRGLSIGLSDIVVSPNIRKKLDDHIREVYEKTLKIIKTAETGAIVPSGTRTKREQYEEDFLKALVIDGKEVMKIIKEEFNPTNNSFIAMVGFGSKGKAVNVNQVAAIRGQITFRGKLCPLEANGRSMCGYQRYVLNPDARGFVENSFLSGLSPSEFFFEQFAARYGVIDTAIKTQESGYISRRFIKAMEDITINYNGLVMNGTGKLIQPIYGEDNLLPESSERVKLKTIKLSDKDLEKEYRMTEEDAEKNLVPSSLARHKKWKMAKEKLDREFKQIKEDRDMMRKIKMDSTVLSVGEEIRLGVNFERIIGNALANQPRMTLSDLEPEYILEKNEALVKMMAQVHTNRWTEPDERFENAVTPMRIAVRAFLGTKMCIVKHKMNRSTFEAIHAEVLARYSQAIAPPGEMVGILSAQVLGEVNTQLTLDSVTGDTLIAFSVNGNTKVYEIGEFIDSHISSFPGLLSSGDKPGDLIVDVSELDIKAMSSDNGSLANSWQKVVQLTSHTTQGENLIEIKTKSGRRITASKSHSFVQWNGENWVNIRGSELKIGDKLPVLKHMDISDNSSINEISLELWLPKTKYIWGSEMKKAKNWKESCGVRNWFAVGKQQGKFILPHKRADSLMKGMIGTKEREIIDGFVFPLNGSADRRIPETFKLDYNLGYLIGAYAAEGCVSPTQIHISNNEPGYFTPIIEKLKEYGVGYHIVKRENIIQEGWSGTDLVIHSTVLTELMKEWCGKLSPNKKIPLWGLSGNKEFLKGVIEAYFSGDGWITQDMKYVMASSVSRTLIEHISMILSRFDIASKIHMPKKQEKNNRGSKNILQHWLLYVPNRNIHKFAKAFTSTIPKKAERLQKCLDVEFRYENWMHDTVPGCDIPREKRLEDDVGKYYFDRIVSIVEVPTTKDTKIYDIAVENTNRFTCFNGLEVHNSFHQSGNLSASKATRGGVARVDALIRFSKKMQKTAAAMIYPTAEYEFDKAYAQAFANKVALTTLSQFVQKEEIWFEPYTDPYHTAIESDKKIVADFEKHSLKKKTAVTSHWLIRLVLNRTKFFNGGLSMSLVRQRIESEIPGGLFVVSSDDNAEELVIRLHLIPSSLPEKNEKITGIDLSFKYKDWALNKLILKGVSGIKAATIIPERRDRILPDGSIGRKMAGGGDGDNDEKESMESFFIETAGSNLEELMSIPGVDASKAYSIDVMEMFSVFGIEACRASILRELKAVFETDIDYRPYSILLDQLTHTGEPVSIYRSGFASSDMSAPFSKITFEVAVQQLVRAASFGDVDNLRGVSGRIALGIPIKGGTNMSNVIYDETSFGLRTSEVDALLDEIL